MLFHDIVCNIHSLTICTYPESKKLLFHVNDIVQAAIFSILRVYKCEGTSTNDFSVKEATFNFKLAECMQKTCGNLNSRLHKNRSYALICDFYWRLSQFHYVLYISLPTDVRNLGTFLLPSISFTNKNNLHGFFLRVQLLIMPKGAMTASHLCHQITLCVCMDIRVLLMTTL